MKASPTVLPEVTAERTALSGLDDGAAASAGLVTERVSGAFGCERARPFLRVVPLCPSTRLRALPSVPLWARARTVVPAIGTRVWDGVAPESLLPVADGTVSQYSSIAAVPGGALHVSALAGEAAASITKAREERVASSGE